MSSAPGNSQDLERLADACRRIVADNPSVAVMANPYLHLLSAHPNSLARYADFFARRRPVRRRLYNWLARQALRLRAAMGPQEPFGGDALPPSADVLMVSHLLNGAQIAKAEDLYFGDLPQQLGAKGLRSVIALIDHTRRRGRNGPTWHEGAVPRVLLNYTVGLAEEWRNGRLLAAAGHALRRSAARQSDSYMARLLRHTAAEAGSSSSLTAMRIGAQIGELVSRLQPKAIVTTFEGHGWERLAYEAARRAKPDIVCIGYHHTVLFPLARAMSERYGHGFDPDCILTAGEITRDWLRAQPQLQGIAVDVLGSARSPANIAAAPSSGAACLVIPEGLVSESVFLFRLAAEAARLSPRTIFRLRLHPVVGREEVLRAAPDLKSLPGNVVWSNASLDADLADSRVALYRGSSAVITAVLRGLRPIYASTSPSEVSIDPLGALETWRERVSSAKELGQALAADAALGEADRQSRYEHARRFCQRYFMPFDVTALASRVAATPNEASARSPVRSEELCIITPTKSRHRQLTCLLTTLAAQTQRVGQIIIADGGRDARAVVEPFADRLSVRWLDCPQPGQIIQRNLALQQVAPEIRVIIYLDDDIQLAPDAIEVLLDFWNSRLLTPAGVSFNITNMPPQPDNPVRHFFCMQTEPRGKVLASGYNTPVTRLTEDVESQWLIGGATAWRKDILMAHVNEGIASRWAITEDLMFSYALWKRGERLFACADARVQHIDDTPVETFKAGMFRGYNATVWRYLFVTRHPELSPWLFLWMMTGQSLARLGSAATGRFWQLGYVLGNARGMSQCLRALLFGYDIRRGLK
jgi:glycosyltransferase involved in cell wall biosynthesis